MARRKGNPDFYCERSVEFVPTQREEAHSDGRTLDGYAAVFGQPTRIASWEGIFDETIDRGAFAKTLSERTPVMQFDHGHDSRTGSVPIGVFTEIKEDDHGLHTVGRLHDNDLVEPIRQAIESGAISGMSFRFQVVRDEWFDKNGTRITKRSELEELLWDPRDRGPLKRNIKEVKLSEAGPVVFPAYQQTSVGVRAHGEEGEVSRESVVDFYARSLPQDEELLEEREDAVPSEDADGQPEVEDTSDVRSDEEPEDAVVERDDTSEGHEEGREAAPHVDEERKESVPMRTIEEMRARIEEIEERQAADEFRADALDAPLASEFDALETERKSLLADIAAAEARQARLAELAKGGNVDKGTPAFHKAKTDQDIYNLGELRSLAYSGQDFLNKVTDNAKFAVERSQPGVERKDRDAARERAMDLLEEKDNETRDLAKRYLLTGSREYAEAFGKVLRYGSDALCTNEERAALIRAQSLGTDGQGGYAVPFQLDPSVILTSAGVVNPIRNLARVEQIVGKEWQGVTSAGISVTRAGEAVAVTDSQITLEQPVVRTNRVQGFVPFSIEIDLTWGALQSEITRMLVDAKAREENSFITGDGTGTNPEGIIGALDASSNVNATTGQAFDVEDLYRLEEALDVRWEPNASFLAHKAIYNKIRQFDTAGGANLWTHIGDGTPARLLDYPNYRSSAMASTTATGNRFLLFGDFKQFLIVDRIGMNVELVPHLLDTTNNRPTGQRGVYAVWMNNSKILVDAAFKVLLGIA